MASVGEHPRFADRDGLELHHKSCNELDGRSRRFQVIGTEGLISFR
jgi:hypothetical protein